MNELTPASLAALLAAALGGLLAGCAGLSPDKAATATPPAALERALQTTRAKHAPDPHLDVFRVGAIEQGGTLVLTGDVASASARTDALAAARAAGFHVKDGITVLPDPALGDATWGLVCLSVATGREQPENPAEMGTQELMGHPLRILRNAGSWALVQTSDRYVSWMEEGSFQRCTAAEADAWRQSPLLLVTAFEDRILETPDPGAQPVTDVVLGDLVRKTGEAGDWYRVELPDHRAGCLPKPSAADYAAWKQSHPPTPEAIEHTARSLLGRPYLWGANSPKAFDCSGFTKFVYFLNGISLDRNASHQARQGADVPLDPNLSRLRKGDLLFFGHREKHGQPERVIHTGIYLGEQLFIHASDRVQINSLDPASPLRDEHRIRTLIRARRVLPPVAAQSHDLIIRNGQVIDGTGAKPRSVDVGIRDGRIVTIGPVAGDAAEVIDATGLVVAPGFIDVHTHADDIDAQPRAENFVRMGVTTVVAGNCGESTPNVAALLHRVERNGASVNFATLVGHSTVRERAMGGSFDRAPTPKETARMQAAVDQAMRDGAFGMSTGLIYPPGSFAQTGELVDAAKAVAQHGGLYASHMRSESDRIFAALDEVFAIARGTHLRAHVSHLKLAGPGNWGQPDKVLCAIQQARSEGLEITQDQYLYTASSTTLSQLIPDWALEGSRFPQYLADPAQQARITAFMRQRLADGKRDDYAYVMIADFPPDRSLNGLRVPEAARKTRGTATLDDQIDLILDIQKNGGASGVFHGISEEDLQVFLRDPNTLIASDSGLRQFGQGVPHPRGYGNSARAIARYVRELNLLPLEEAVRRMTSLPAATFGFEDRGTLREGAWADLVIFDPAKVRDNATFENPHQYATGFTRVIVNGVTVVRNDTHTDARPGRPLRHSARH